MSYTTDYLTKYRAWVKPMLTDIANYAESLGKTYNASVYRELIENIEAGKSEKELYRIAEMVDKIGVYYFKIIKYKYIENMTNTGISKEMGIPLNYIDRDTNKIYEFFTRDATKKYVMYGQEFLDGFKKACEYLRNYEYCIDLDITDFNVSIRFADEVCKFHQGRMYYILNCIATCDLTPLKSVGISENTIRKLFKMLEEYKLIPYWVGELQPNKLTIPLRPPYNILFTIGELNDNRLQTPDASTMSYILMQEVTKDKLIYTLVNVLNYRENRVVIEKYFNRKTHKEIAESMGITASEVNKISTNILRKLRSRDAQRLLMNSQNNVVNCTNFTSLIKEQIYTNYMNWFKEHPIYGRANEI